MEAYAKSRFRSNNKNRSAMIEVKVNKSFDAPAMDGVLSKNEWKDAALIFNFTQKEPLEGQPVSEPTFVLITYDKKYIYFGIRCFDNEPHKIVANEMRRDSDLSNNDYFEIIIDTFHDQRNAYYFATNSLGARLDSEIKTEGEHINWDWDGVWYSNARKDQYGWTAEVAIPFKTLRFEGDNLSWGINFGRYIPRKREQAYWSPISRDDDFNNFGKFKVSKFGVLRGLKNIRHDQRFQFKPYVVGGLEKNFDLTASTEKLADAGLDTKIHLTSNLISDLTINTDFAQVEADVEQVNLSRFQLFFPEKRVFFLEGLSTFNVGEESYGEPFTLLFFSRQIGLHRDPFTFDLREVPLIGGVKTTGKAGPYEIGLLNVVTNDLHYTSIDANLDTSQIDIPRTNHLAVRLKRDIFKRSYVGILGLSKDPLEGANYNRTFAVDGVFSFDNNFSVNGYFAKTLTPGLRGDDYNGFVDLSWGNDKVYTRAAYTDIGKNFNPEMGFLQWSDIRKYNLQFFISPRPQIFKIRQSHFSYDLEYITNHQNQLQYRTLNFGLLNIFNNESYLSLGVINYYDRIPAEGIVLGQAVIPPGVYNYNIFAAAYSSDHSRKLGGSLQVGGGTFYNGTFWGVRLTNYWKPNDQLGIDLSWNWNRVDVPFPNGQFTSSIVGGRINYSFTPNLFTKAYLQWNHYDKRIISNFLVNFIHTPGSDFYLVYNEEWNTGNKFKTENRTVLAKITYLLNL